MLTTVRLWGPSLLLNIYCSAQLLSGLYRHMTSQPHSSRFRHQLKKKKHLLAWPAHLFFTW
jgi:hypothetical protein